MQTVIRTYEGIGRYGGEEFLVVLPDCGAETPRHVAERMRVAVSAAPVETDQAVIAATISVGVTWSSNLEEPTDVLIRTADEALYRAKAMGRNRVEYAETASASQAMPAACAGSSSHLG